MFLVIYCISIFKIFFKGEIEEYVISFYNKFKNVMWWDNFWGRKLNIVKVSIIKSKILILFLLKFFYNIMNSLFFGKLFLGIYKSKSNKIENDKIVNV